MIDGQRRVIASTKVTEPKLGEWHHPSGCQGHHSPGVLRRRPASRPTMTTEHSPEAISGSGPRRTRWPSSPTLWLPVLPQGNDVGAARPPRTSRESPAGSREWKHNVPQAEKPWRLVPDN